MVIRNKHRNLKRKDGIQKLQTCYLNFQTLVVPDVTGRMRATVPILASGDKTFLSAPGPARAKSQVKVWKGVSPEGASKVEHNSSVVPTGLTFMGSCLRVERLLTQSRIRAQTTSNRAACPCPLREVEAAVRGGPSRHCSLDGNTDFISSWSLSPGSLYLLVLVLPHLSTPREALWHD